MEIFNSRKQMKEYEGKTIKELEGYLGNSKRAPGFKYNRKTLLTALVIIVLLLSAGSVIWKLNNEITKLNHTVLQLTRENELLKNELALQRARQQVTQPERVISQPPGPQNGDYIFHSIQSGDSLSLLSKRYYNTIKYASHLAQLNGISVDSRLNLGQIIKVPRQPEKAWPDSD